MEYLIKRSLKLNEPVEIIYVKTDGAFSKRTIVVKEILMDSIKAFCLKQRQPRTFKTDSILAASTVKRHRERGLRYA